jgi:hypothetical protein
MTQEGKAYMARGRPLEVERELLEAFSSDDTMRIWGWKAIQPSGLD